MHVVPGEQAAALFTVIVPLLSVANPKASVPGTSDTLPVLIPVFPVAEEGIKVPLLFAKPQFALNGPEGSCVAAHEPFNSCTLCPATTGS